MGDGLKVELVLSWGDEILLMKTLTPGQELRLGGRSDALFPEDSPELVIRATRRGAVLEGLERVRHVSTDAHERVELGELLLTIRSCSDQDSEANSKIESSLRGVPRCVMQFGLSVLLAYGCALALLIGMPKSEPLAIAEHRMIPANIERWLAFTEGTEIWIDEEPTRRFEFRHPAHHYESLAEFLDARERKRLWQEQEFAKELRKPNPYPRGSRDYEMYSRSLQWAMYRSVVPGYFVSGPALRLGRGPTREQRRALWQEQESRRQRAVDTMLGRSPKPCDVVERSQLEARFGVAYARERCGADRRLPAPLPSTDVLLPDIRIKVRGGTREMKKLIGEQDFEFARCLAQPWQMARAFRVRTRLRLHVDPSEGPPLATLLEAHGGTAETERCLLRAAEQLTLGSPEPRELELELAAVSRGVL